MHSLVDDKCYFSQIQTDLTSMWLSIFLLGILIVLIGSVGLIVAALRNRPKRKLVIAMVGGFSLIALSAVFGSLSDPSPRSTSARVVNTPAPQSSTPPVSDGEILSAGEHAKVGRDVGIPCFPNKDDFDSYDRGRTARDKYALDDARKTSIIVDHNVSVVALQNQGWIQGSVQLRVESGDFAGQKCWTDAENKWDNKHFPD